MGAVAAANESSFLAESSFIAAADAECASATLSWCARRRDGAAPSAQRGLSRVQWVGAVWWVRQTRWVRWVRWQ